MSVPAGDSECPIRAIDVRTPHGFFPTSGRTEAHGAFEATERPPARASGHEGKIPRPRSQRPHWAQQRALWAICNRSGLNLEAICLDEFDVQRADALDIRQASSLIDKLKMQTETAGGVR